jgi:pimeloyl-ACP methyl ester carboxylesterase
MPYLELSSGTRMFFTDDGDGRPVLSLHGWACDGSDWSWFVPEMPGYRHLVVDHRGHGRSSIGDGRFSSRLFAEDAAELTDRLGTGPCVVVGHSMGGGVASALAVFRPDLVEALVLIDPGIGGEDDLLARVLDELRADPVKVAATMFGGFSGAATPRWMPAWHRRRALGTAPETILGAAAGTFLGDDAFARRVVAERRLAERTCPTLTIWAGAQTALAAWDRTLPHGDRDVIEVWAEHGHFLHQEAPERFARRVREWLDGIGLGPEV